MSTLRVSNIADTAGSNSSTPSAIANGIAKAWVNFNGSGTIAIRASFNVSSITDGGAGIYGINFANALADANHSASVGFEGLGYPVQWANVMAGTASSVTVYTYIASGGTAYAVDSTRCCVTVHR